MSTADQTLSSRITGEAELAAQRAELQPIIDQLAEVCQGRDDLRIDAAGRMAGAWFANPEAAPRWGYDLIAARMQLPSCRNLQHAERLGQRRRQHLSARETLRSSRSQGPYRRRTVRQT